LLSVLLAVERAPTEGNVLVFSASEYVVSNLGLIPRWEANGWRNAGRKPVANKELWMSLHDRLKSKPGVSIRLLPKTDEEPEIEAAHIACQGLAQAAARLANSRPLPAMPERAHLQLVEDDSPLF
jgi:ribonuclease HI